MFSLVWSFSLEFCMKQNLWKRNIFILNKNDFDIHAVRKINWRLSHRELLAQVLHNESAANEIVPSSTSYLTSFVIDFNTSWQTSMIIFASVFSSKTACFCRTTFNIATAANFSSFFCKSSILRFFTKSTICCRMQLVSKLTSNFNDLKIVMINVSILL